MLSAAVFGMEDGDGFLRVVDFSCMSGIAKLSSESLLLLLMMILLSFDGVSKQLSR